MSEIMMFNNQEFGEIRTIERDGEVWFVGKDIATALGYSNTNDAISRHVDDEDKYQGEGVAFPDPHGVMQYPTIINESGLYGLVLSSKLPNAKKFKRWITSEVIPSIRKHGAYMTPDVMERALSDPDFLISLAQQLKNEQEKRKALQKKVDEQMPAVRFAGAVETAKTTILIGELAKILKQNGINVGQNRLFDWLRNNGYLVKRKGTDYNMPTQRSMEMGLFEIKERTIIQPDGSVTICKTAKVTGKGQVYFVNLFLNNDNK